jgi:hypothetical protein
MWKRLALLLPGGALALGAGVWFLLRPCPAAVRVPFVLLAATVAILQLYLAARTMAAVGERKDLPLQVARMRRRELRPAALVSLLSLSFLAVLGLIPTPFPASPSPQDPGPLSRWRPHVRAPQAPEPEHAPVVPEIPVAASVPEPPAPAAPSQEEPAPEQRPVPVAAKPEIRPAILLEPAHLTFEEIDPPPVPPLVPEPATPVAQEFPGPDDDSAPFRSDREHFGPIPRSGWLIGLQYRPLPDENDRESLPPLEARIEGFLLLGGGDRVPGLTLALDLPVGRHDVIQVSWLAADLPRNEDVDRGLSANWHHATLAYVRHLSGYTSHAKFDLAVSLGASVDFFGSVAGIPDSGGAPKFAPYAGIDMAFWQENAFGLLLHLGECLPWTVVGSSLGVTDFSAQIRWDLTERISVHGGYRVLLLHYKLDASPAPPGTDLLHAGLSGPMLGIDVRF